MSDSAAGQGAGGAASLGRYGEAAARLRASVLGEAGTVERSVRRAVEARAGRRSGRAGGPVEVPAELEGFVDTVTDGAYRVTPEQIDDLSAAGYSEDQVFEVTVSAAVGAALGRLERAMAALRGEV